MTTATKFDPTTVDLSEDRVNAILDELVAEKGADYVYPRASKYDGFQVIDFGSCVNVEPGKDGKLKPSCIVGHVFVRAGVPVEKLGDAEHGNDLDLAGSTAGAVIDTLGLHATPKVCSLLIHVQSAQDDGIPWGEAVYEARAVVESRYARRGGSE